MTNLSEFPNYVAIHVVLSIVKDINDNEQKLITQRLRNTKRPQQKPVTVNLFNQDEAFDEYRQQVHISNGGLLPEDQPETFQNNPFSTYQNACVVNFMFPCPAYAKTKDGFLMDVNNQRVIQDHCKVLALVDYIDANGNPVYNADFDPQVEGMRQFNNRFLPVTPTDTANSTVEENVEVPKTGAPQGNPVNNGNPANGNNQGGNGAGNNQQRYNNGQPSF